MGVTAVTAHVHPPLPILAVSSATTVKIRTQTATSRTAPGRQTMTSPLQRRRRMGQRRRRMGSTERSLEVSAPHASSFCSQLAQGCATSRHASAGTQLQIEPQLFSIRCRTLQAPEEAGLLSVFRPAPLSTRLLGPPQLRTQLPIPPQLSTRLLGPPQLSTQLLKRPQLSSRLHPRRFWLPKQAHGKYRPFLDTADNNYQSGISEGTWCAVHVVRESRRKLLVP